MIEVEMDITAIRNGVIAHGCNCKGAFASGVAKAIKERYPTAERVFKAIPPCEEMLGVCVPVKVSPDVFVCNLYTQLSYGRDGQRYANVDAIDKALTQAIEFAARAGKNLYVPRIGCGLGGLDWETDVKQVFEAKSEIAERAGIKLIVCSI